jgi:hypothetical protein
MDEIVLEKDQPMHFLLCLIVFFLLCSQLISVVLALVLKSTACVLEHADLEFKGAYLCLKLSLGGCELGL